MNNTTSKDDDTSLKETFSPDRNARIEVHRKVIEQYYPTLIDKLYPDLCDEYKSHIAKYYKEKSRKNGFYFTSPKNGTIQMTRDTIRLTSSNSTPTGTQKTQQQNTKTNSSPITITIPSQHQIDTIAASSWATA